MIKQLKGAGLGWRDKEPSRATEKLGKLLKQVIVIVVTKIILHNRGNTIERLGL